MIPRSKLRTLPPVPTQQCLQTFQFKVRAEIAFGQKQNVFIFVSIVIKMWAWIPEEIKHKGRKQAEIESEASEAREKMMTHKPPLKTFYGAREWGVEKGIFRDWENGTPRVGQGYSLAVGGLWSTCARCWKSFERRPNKGENFCLHFCLSVESLWIWNPPPPLLHTLKKVYRWKNLKLGFNMKKKEKKKKAHPGSWQLSPSLRSNLWSSSIKY